jgi:hypothetical protein
MIYKTFLEELHAALAQLRWTLSALKGEGQAQAIRSMERMVYFAWLLETKADAAQVKVFIEQAVKELDVSSRT